MQNFTKKDQKIQKKLSKRELELFVLLSKGFSFKQCAQIMDVKESTVKTLGARGYKKLGAHNIQTALHEARTEGFIT